MLMYRVKRRKNTEIKNPKIGRTKNNPFIKVCSV